MSFNRHTYQFKNRNLKVDAGNVFVNLEGRLHQLKITALQQCPIHTITKILTNQLYNNSYDSFKVFTNFWLSTMTDQYYSRPLYKINSFVHMWSSFKE